MRPLRVQGDLYRRRADIVGFVNGLPLLFMELKNADKNIRAAYDNNLKDYKDTIPHLFHHNAFIVLANGVDAKIGSVTAGYHHFYEWKRLSEDAPGAVNMQTLLKGVCSKANFIDLLENFILFDESAPGGVRKIIAANHQYLGVNRAVEAIKARQGGRLGVFWHTQGAGKSCAMVMFTRKIHRKIAGDYTCLLLTDRDELDEQIYKTFVGCGSVQENDRCRAAGGEHLKALLAENKTHVFSLIQKFNQRLQGEDCYTARDKVIVISDEAHRSQYGELALNMRRALPNAAFIGFTGTPLFKNDEITRQVFGDYVSVYDFQRAVEDGVTVPLYYSVRGEKLGLAANDLSEQFADKLAELDTGDIDAAQRLEKELQRSYHIITASRRLEQVARDFVSHYAKGGQTGKAMLVCIDKISCARMHRLITQYWEEHIQTLQQAAPAADAEEEEDRQARIKWMRETRMAVVISEEQNEVDKFRQWGIDIKPIRRLIKEGIELPPELRAQPRFANMQRLPLDEAFKLPAHPFRVAIVCAMWLTGFDVPSLSSLYLDKPLKAHTLMQAIARASRNYEGKNNGLIIDYCGVLGHLRRALAVFTRAAGESEPLPPLSPDRELLEELKKAIAMARDFLAEREVLLSAIIRAQGFDKNAAINEAKEAVNESGKTRKRFEIICREVFKKYKACFNLEGVEECRDARNAINAIYKSLQADREQADISHIIRALHDIIDAAVTTRNAQTMREGSEQSIDISRIDFERLRQEFARLTGKRTTVQNLITAVAGRLQRMLAQNAGRINFQRHYEEIIAAYNREKDRATVEQTFAELLQLVQTLDEEEKRAAQEGISEEQLAMFDLLQKPALSPLEIKKVKTVAADLLAALKRETLQVSRWQEKEFTRDAVRAAINDFLYDEATGLPDNYQTEEVAELAEEVYRHVYRVYPSLPSPVYEKTA